MKFLNVIKINTELEVIFTPEQLALLDDHFLNINLVIAEAKEKDVYVFFQGYSRNETKWFYAGYNLAPEETLDAEIIFSFLADSAALTLEEFVFDSYDYVVEYFLKKVWIHLVKFDDKL